ncbi:MAG: aminomethyl-transferring glycine dehydrogenase subunit GcvPB [Brevinematales bacterium]|jgi:glycine dehydrogenase subunit 2
MNRMEKLIFEKSVPGRKGFRVPPADVPVPDKLPGELLSSKDSGSLKCELPEVGEQDVVRHYTKLSRLNFSADSEFYPLGSCTMKYNPKVLEKAAEIPGFTGVHPLECFLDGGENLVQGALAVIYNLSELLAEITGMDSVTTSPMAGAHGEMTGILIISRYHKAKGNNKKKYVIVPDSSHGTNPASAAMAGYEIITVKSLENGEMDIEEFKRVLNDETAAVMMTCPNTLGIFETRIGEIAALAHEAGALMYYDGANLNAILGKVKPGEAGFDVVHVNLHKTFGTPHGGGGPGAGPVGVKRELAEFLPAPMVTKNSSGIYSILPEKEGSIGRVSGYFGNFGVLVRAYAYILLLGREGLISVSEQAVLNANYIRVKLKEVYTLPYDRICMHECVFSAEKQLPYGIHALDIAKGLIDRGIHPPTVYFPLIVKEAIMIEPTETENRDTLDSFISEMKEIARIAEFDPGRLQAAPVSTPVTRLDETKAAREMRVCFG